MNRLALIILILFSNNLFSQGTDSVYKIGRTYKGDVVEYSFINKKGDTIKKLDSDKYYSTLNIEFKNFAVFGIKGKKGWTAIDINEKHLFEVYNKYSGEPSPDDLTEDRIRIVGENGKIGYADEKGKIIIKPQFVFATHFSKGFAIVGSKCQKISNPHNNEADCQHVSIKCDQYGYIDKSGSIIKLGNYTFKEIKGEINWQELEY